MLKEASWSIWQSLFHKWGSYSLGCGLVLYCTLDAHLLPQKVPKFLQVSWIRSLIIFWNGLQRTFDLSNVFHGDAFCLGLLFVHWILSLKIDAVFKKWVFGLGVICYLFNLARLFQIQTMPHSQNCYFMQMGAVAWEWIVIGDMQPDSLAFNMSSSNINLFIGDLTTRKGKGQLLTVLLLSYVLCHIFWNHVRVIAFSFNAIYWTHPLHEVCLAACLCITYYRLC